MKKYALTNSYFKNKRPGDPDTPTEILDFLEENGELPFSYDGDNWPYDTVCERQKRCGVELCQHLTPDATAARMAELAREFAPHTDRVVDACCGTGQLTKALMAQEFTVSGFDADPEMMALYHYLYPHNEGSRLADFRELSGQQYELVVSNPPFDRQIAVEFMAWLTASLESGGRAVLLLPKGYVDKDKPKALVQELGKLTVLHREDMRETFRHTQSMCEIVVVEKKTE